LKKQVVPDAEANKQENAVTKPVEAPPAPVVPVSAAADAPKPQEPAKPDVVSIVDIIKGIPEEKAQMAENLGVPVRPILKWMYQTEMQQKEILGFLQQLGAKLQSSAPNTQQLALPTGQQPAGLNLASLMQLVPQVLGSGGEDMFTQIGREFVMGSIRDRMSQESMGTWVMKDVFKKVYPQAIAGWEAEQAAKAAK
jgi:hypothetical protein